MMSLIAALLMTSLPVRIEVTSQLLDGLPRQQATLTHHDETLVCEGPLLADVLVRVGMPSGETVRGPALRQGVVARARDGYGVLFSLGELDARLGNAKVILADICDGKPLMQDDGPFRLAVPGDQRGARSVRQLIALEIASID